MHKFLNMKNFSPAWVICIVCLPFMISCKKDRKDTLGNTITLDNSTAENLFSDLFKVVDNVSMNESGIRENEIGCIDSIHVDTTSMPRTVLIDFGTDDCVGIDGRIRKGQVLVSYNGRYRDEGTVITIAPINYLVNGYQLSGTKVVSNLGLNQQGNIAFSIVLNGSITAPGNAWSAQWNSNRVRTWVEGSGTLSIWDDVYEISGTASGVNRNGLPYDVLITIPLRAAIGCRWLVSGRMILTPDGYDSRTIDFGNGECNNGFSVTVNGETDQYGTQD